MNFNFYCADESSVNKVSAKLKKSSSNIFFHERNFLFQVNSNLNDRVSFYSSEEFFICGYSLLDYEEKDYDNNDSRYALIKYLKEGKKFFSKLNGSFSFIIFNKIKKQLFAVTDHMNLKPIYYCNFANGLFFSNKLQNMFDCNFLSRNLDEEVLYDYLVTGLPRNNRTLFSGLSVLQNNHCLTFDIVSKKISLLQYYKFKSNKFDGLDLFEDTRTKFLRSLEYPFKKSPRNIATMLSGGIDSSSISSCLDYLNLDTGEKQIHSYSAVFTELAKDEKLIADESEYIDEVLSATSLRAKKIDFSNSGPLSALEEVSKLSEPALGPNIYVNLAFMKSLSAKGIQILFEGNGGDSIIGHGYGRFLELARRMQYYSLYNEYKDFCKALNRDLNFSHFFKQYILKNFEPLYFQKRRILTKNKIDYFNPNILLKKEHQIDSFQHFEKIHGFLPYLNIPINKSIKSIEAMSANSLFASYGNRAAFHMGEKHNVEVISPFFDKDLMKHCINIDLKYKLKKGLGRNYFRKALENHVPKKIMNRPDKGDISPVFNKNMNSIMLSEVKEILNSSGNDFFSKIIDSKKVKNLYEIDRGKSNKHGTTLYKFLYLSKWLKNNL
tara:strand:- start:345 stop:2168 length:1824 start_codon:yes stop_codon:yes gene_type:complete